MPIELRCPGCHRLLRVQDSLQGKRIRCPKCAHLIEVQPTSGAADLLDGGADIPQGKTRPDPDFLARATEKKDDPQVTGEYTPAPEHTRGLDDDSSHDPNVTRDSDDAGDLRGRKTMVAPQGGKMLALGGYEVLKELGRGGMGTVFLARQTSLDRLVALKVMDPRRAGNPAFLARFTREAYASAQLVHHNVVQIYDIGADRDVHFYSMEYVKGESLLSLVQREGRLDTEVAAGYILQAARGLKFGHDMGMVHRDIKPDNLLLNEHGIVKVADLGLVKIPHTEDPAGDGAEAEPAPGKGSGLKGPSNVTRLGVVVGTPTYMAPEQARDSSHVDGRADIYSLGCTLYVLITGKPPFEGKTAIEVITKHQSSPLVPPEAIVKRVPKALSAILLKMLAKKPEDRYPDMAAVIADLEKFLGVQPSGAFTPREEHANFLEQCLKQYNEAPHLKWRRLLVPGFAGSCLLALVTCLLFGWLRPAGGFLGLALMTPLFYALIRGWKEKTYLFRKVREWALGSSWKELAYGLAGATLFLLILHLLGLLWCWLGMGVLAVGLAAACLARLDRPLARQRRPAVDRAEKLLRHMRLQGLEEGALRAFVCKYSGRDWEDFYEALFGYRAKCKAREWLRGEAAARRHKFAPWRDPIVAWIEARQQARKEARERQLLQAVEAKALEAQGLNRAEAQQKAAQVAEVMVSQAAEIHKEAARVPEAEAPPQPALRQLLQTAQQPETVKETTMPRRGSTAVALLTTPLSAPVRFLAGALLLAGWALWMQQNQFLEDDRLIKIITTAIADNDWKKLDRPGNPLEVPMLPMAARELVTGFQPGLAGLILLVSAFLGGWKASLIAWPAALVTVLGPSLGMPALGPLSPGLLSMAIGLVLAVVGLFLRFGRKAEK